MMALQLKNGDAAYYQSAEYCRNYTSPPVSYGDSSHYLARLPGKERLAVQDLPSVCSPMRLCAGMEKNLTRDICRWHRGRWVLKPADLMLLLPSSCHVEGVHQPSFRSVFGCCNAKSEVVEIVLMVSCAVGELRISCSRETSGLTWCLIVI